MDIFDDLEAEQDRMEEILSDLDGTQWTAASAASGWTIADVVLHLAQTEEAVVFTVGQGTGGYREDPEGLSVEEAVERSVRAERCEPDVAFERWKSARSASLEALRSAAPDRELLWAFAPLRPRTLATTRLAEHWAHGLDITGPLGISFDDTDRLRHVAWLAHRSLPYSFELIGEAPHDVYCELVGPNGDLWRYGEPDSESVISGPAGDFCRIGARRLAPQQSHLVARGPYADVALRALRNYAA